MSSWGLKIAIWIVDNIPVLDLSVPTVNVLSIVSNIFAWVSYFLPVSLILTILSVSAGFYVFKLFVRLFRYVREVM